METTSPAHPVDSVFYKPADTFFREHQGVGLTYDDVTLATRFSEVLPRQTTLDAKLSEGITLHIPVISADMDTVTESSMAVAMARNGGLGLIHYNMPEKDQVKEVARVKNDVHGLIMEPITVGPDQTIGEVLELAEEKSYKFRTFPVVDDKNVFLGLLRGRVVKERYAAKMVYEAMTPLPEVLTVLDTDIADNPIAHADRLFNENMGIHKLIVLDRRGVLKGLFTMTDIERIRDEESRSAVRAARDAKFRLLCGAALSAPRDKSGALDRDRIIGHASALVREGVDVLAVSTAHGHSAGVGDVLKLLRAEFPDLTLIAGNVTSGEGVEYLADCGANAIKIGQGPGSICTTRIVAGVGIPQLTALYVASRAAAKRGVKIIGDGGITKSGDIVKALTLADAVICGGLLAGCREAPGQVMEINGQLFKQYRGMGSLEAMKAGSAARYGHTKGGKTDKVAPEGIEALKEVSGSVDDTLRVLMGGLQSGMGYLGARDLAALKTQARYIRVSPAGQKEASPHDVIEVKTQK